MRSIFTLFLTLIYLILAYGQTSSAQSFPTPGAQAGQQKTEEAAGSAESGSGAANQMGGMQIATGTVMLCCVVTEPPGIVLIAMGVLSMLQGADESDSSGKNFGNADLMAQTQGRNPTTIKPPTALTPAQAQALAAHGVSVDLKKGTLKTKEGKVIPLSAFASKAGAIAAGFSAGDVDKAWGETEKIASKVDADLKAGKFGSGVDGGVAGGRGGGYGDGGVVYQEAPRMPSGKIDEKGAGLSGMKKNYNGDPIGVAADDIFIMMNRRYDSEVKQSKFFGLRETVVP